METPTPGTRTVDEPSRSFNNKEKALVGAFSGHCETSRRFVDSSIRAQHRRIDLAIDQANRLLEEAWGRGLPLDQYPLYHNYENIGTGATFLRGHQNQGYSL